MKVELTRKYTWKEFKEEFYQQDPCGTISNLYYCWNMYQLNKSGTISDSYYHWNMALLNKR